MTEEKSPNYTKRSDMLSVLIKHVGGRLKWGERRGTPYAVVPVGDEKVINVNYFLPDTYVIYGPGGLPFAFTSLKDIIKHINGIKAKNSGDRTMNTMDKKYVANVGGFTLNMVRFSGIWWVNWMEFKTYLKYDKNSTIGQFCERRKIGHLVKDHAVLMPVAGCKTEQMYISTMLAIKLTELIANPKKPSSRTAVRTDTAITIGEALRSLCIKGIWPAKEVPVGIPGACLKKEPKKLVAKKVAAKPVPVKSTENAIAVNKLITKLADTEDKLSKVLDDLINVKEISEGRLRHIDKQDATIKQLNAEVKGLLVLLSGKNHKHAELLEELKLMAANKDIPDFNYRSAVWAIITQFQSKHA